MPTYKNVTTLTRSVSRAAADSAFCSVEPDHFLTGYVEPPAGRSLISTDPLTAGTEYHQLLERMRDNGPLSEREKAYYPWLRTMRQLLRRLGVRHMEAAKRLSAYRSTPRGECDLMVWGGPQNRGIVEVKVISRGHVETCRGRDLFQLATYARLAAKAGSYDAIWAAVAYIELAANEVHLAAYKTSRALIETTRELLQAA